MQIPMPMPPFFLPSLREYVQYFEKKDDIKRLVPICKASGQLVGWLVG